MENISNRKFQPAPTPTEKNLKPDYTTNNNDETVKEQQLETDTVSIKAFLTEIYNNNNIFYYGASITATFFSILFLFYLTSPYGAGSDNQQYLRDKNLIPEIPKIAFVRLSGVGKDGKPFQKSLKPVDNVPQDAFTLGKIAGHALPYWNDMLESYARRMNSAHLCMHHMQIAAPPVKFCVVLYNNGTDALSIINPYMTGHTSETGGMVRVLELSTFCPKQGAVVRTRYKGITVTYTSIDGSIWDRQFVGTPAYALQVALEEFEGQTSCNISA